MVESNMTVSIIYTWLVKNLHNMLFSFALSLVLIFPSWLLLYSDFIAFTFSVSPTSAVFSTQLHKTHRTLWRTSCTVLCILHCLLICPRPLSSVHVMHEFLSVHVSANECKLTFVTVTDTYIRMYVQCENSKPCANALSNNCLGFNLSPDLSWSHKRPGH